MRLRIYSQANWHGPWRVTRVRISDGDRGRVGPRGQPRSIVIHRNRVLLAGGCTAATTAATMTAGNSTGAADRVSQPVEPTARVLLQHGRSSLGPSKPQPSESGDPLKDGGQMPSSPEASSSDGFLSPRTGTYPPAGPVLDLPSGRVADGGVTASVDGMMVDATVWRTCINKHRTRYIRHTLASYGFPHPSTGIPPRRFSSDPNRAYDVSACSRADEVGSPTVSDLARFPCHEAILSTSAMRQ